MRKATPIEVFYCRLIADRIRNYDPSWPPEGENPA